MCKLRFRGNKIMEEQQEAEKQETAGGYIKSIENPKKTTKKQESGINISEKSLEPEFSAKLGIIHKSFFAIIPRQLIACHPQYLGKGRVVRFKLLLGKANNGKEAKK